MRNVRQLLTLFAVLLVATFILSGCATGPAFPKIDEVSALKGQTSEAILQRLGPPSSRYTDSNNNMVWEYKQLTSSRNLGMSIAMGMSNGSDKVYVDIMRLTFYRGVVANHSYEENTLNVPSSIQPAMSVSEPTPAPEKALESTPVAKKKTTKR